MQNNQIVNVKNFLELEKDFMELKDKDLKYGEERDRRETEKLFHKPIIMSKYDMDQFVEQTMKKIRPIKKKLVRLVN